MVDKQSCYCAQWSSNPRLNSMDGQIYLFLGPARSPLPSSHLCLGGGHSGGASEGVDSPAQVGGVAGDLERQTLTQGGLVHLERRLSDVTTLPGALAPPSMRTCTTLHPAASRAATSWRRAAASWKACALRLMSFRGKDQFRTVTGPVSIPFMGFWVRDWASCKERRGCTVTV